MIDQPTTDSSPLESPIEVRVDEHVRQAIDASWLQGNLKRIVDLLAERDGVAIARVCVLIVDDSRMIALHARHSRDASTTDVLTFDMRGDASKPIDADIAVCVDEAARRAADMRHAIERELLLYSLHGLLHCMGHDDHDDAAWRAMHAREDEILEAIGVGATFARDRSQPEDLA